MVHINKALSVSQFFGLACNKFNEPPLTISVQLLAVVSFADLRIVRGCKHLESPENLEAG